MKRPKLDLTGERIGHCVVLGLDKARVDYDYFWRLLCDCGNECVKSHQVLRKKHPDTRCFACFTRSVSESKRTHGETNGYLFRLWENMNRRCYDKRFTGYARWGGKGVQVFEPWRKDYLAFATWIRENIGERPSAKFSIDRKDNNGHYVPGNLRWATRQQQALNRQTGWRWSDDCPKREQMREQSRQQAAEPPKKRGRPRKPLLDTLI